jgi:hypothetical protein
LVRIGRPTVWPRGLLSTLRQPDFELQLSRAPLQSLDLVPRMRTPGVLAQGHVRFSKARADDAELLQSGDASGARRVDVVLTRGVHDEFAEKVMLVAM